jgi:hypothetical protein
LTPLKENAAQAAAQPFKQLVKRQIDVFQEKVYDFTKRGSFSVIIFSTWGFKPMLFLENHDFCTIAYFAP